MLQAELTQETEQRAKAIRAWLRHPEANFFRDQLRHHAAKAQLAICELYTKPDDLIFQQDLETAKNDLAFFLRSLDMVEKMLANEWEWTKVSVRVLSEAQVID